jgi:hypothetical protein
MSNRRARRYRRPGDGLSRNGTSRKRLVINAESQVFANSVENFQLKADANGAKRSGKCPQDTTNRSSNSGIDTGIPSTDRIIPYMAEWYIYEVRWKHDIPPFANNLRVANARLRRADYDAPILTVDGFVHRWRNPTITAKDVFRILYESNTNVGLVMRRLCSCEDWDACDAGLTDCTYRRTYAGENEDDVRCVWYDENYAKFYEHNHPSRILKSKRNIRKWPVGNRKAPEDVRMPSRTATKRTHHNRKKHRLQFCLPRSK